MRWFNADLHLGHFKSLLLCKRPFISLNDMHCEIVQRHNALVHKRDQTWFLGDASFMGVKSTKEILEQMNGTKYLVEGNHDGRKNKNMRRYLAMGFHEVYQYKKIKIGDHDVMLSHYPYWPKWWERIFMRTNQIRYPEYRLTDCGLWLLCGHVHNAWKTRRKMINVGVDQWAYAPVSETEIEGIFDGKK